MSRAAIESYNSKLEHLEFFKDKVIKSDAKLLEKGLAKAIPKSDETVIDRPDIKFNLRSGSSYVQPAFGDGGLTHGVLSNLKGGREGDGIEAWNLVQQT